jgi:OmcA/MtrC family decaheme c-type cytochrome
VLVGCQGAHGTNGTNGATGAAGTNSVSTLPAALNISAMSLTEWSNLSLTGKVVPGSVTVKNGIVSLTFLVTNSQGTPIAGLEGKDPSGFSGHFGFSIAKLEAGAAGGSSNWVNYEWIVPGTSSSAATLNSHVDPEMVAANLVANGDGTYTYTYQADIANAVANLASATLTAAQSATVASLGNLASEPNAVHRVLILVGGNATMAGTASSLPAGVKKAANITYDFLPSAPTVAIDPSKVDTRNIVDVNSCNACHTALTLHANYMPPVNDTKACVVCHTPQMGFGATDSFPVAGTSGAPAFQGATAPTAINGATMVVAGVTVPYFPNFIHKIHMGDQLTYSASYSLYGTPFNTLYPQDIRNCTTCHTNQAQSAVVDAPPVAVKTYQGDSWMSNPTRATCGACHDSVDFSSGHGLNVAGLSDDSQCAGCHTAPNGNIATYHTPVWTPSQAGVVVGHSAPTLALSSTYQATNTANLPAGALPVRWNLIQATAPNGVPTLTFNYLVNEQPVAFNAPGSASMFPATGPGSTLADLFVTLTSSTSNDSGPQFILLAGLPQDGITPADYNFKLSASIRAIWAGAATVFPANTGTTPLYTFTDNTAVAIGTAAAGVPKYTITLNPAAYSLPSNTGVITMGVGLGLLAETDLHKVDSNLVSNFNPLGMTAPFSEMDFGYTAGNGTTVPIGGLLLPAKAALINVAASTTGIPTLSRRTIIKDNACNVCHGTLGAFTAITGTNNFHSVGIGDSNDGASCIICHNTSASNENSTGWNINAKTWVHGLHASVFRDNAFMPQSQSFDKIVYPGQLNNCEACHTPGSYDFSNATNAAQVANMLWDVEATGTLATAAVGSSTIAAVTPTFPTTTYKVPPSRTAILAAGGSNPVVNVPAAAATGTQWVSPWVSQSLAYGTYAKPAAPTTLSGAGSTWTNVANNNSAVFPKTQVVTGNAAVPPTAGVGSCVTSPITAACAACHDTAAAVNHFRANGGYFYSDRVAVAKAQGKSFFGDGLLTQTATTSPFATTYVTTTTVSGANTVSTFYSAPLSNTESCLVCHGSGGVADIQAVHMNF